MILDFKEQIVGDFLIPAFTLNKGDIIVINLLNSRYFFELIEAMNKLLIQTNQQNTTSPLIYVERHLVKRNLRERLLPTTIDKWLKTNANLQNSIYKEDYNHISKLPPKTQIRSFNGVNLKILSILTTLSYTNNLTVDLAAVQPVVVEDVFSLLKKTAANGGAVIVYDRYDEFKDECTLYLEAKYLKSSFAD